MFYDVYFCEFIRVRGNGTTILSNFEVENTISIISSAENKSVVTVLRELRTHHEDGCYVTNYLTL